MGLAPSAMQRLAGGGGEVDTAKAATNVGLNMTLSSQSTSSLEEVMQARRDASRVGLSEGEHAATPPPFWMQLYLYDDLNRSSGLIRRAEGTNTSSVTQAH